MATPIALRTATTGARRDLSKAVRVLQKELRGAGIRFQDSEGRFDANARRKKLIDSAI